MTAAPPDPEPIPQPIPQPTMTHHELLESLHAVLAPRTYLEIGVRSGRSLSLSRARSIAVSPAYGITTPLQCDLRVFRRDAEEFFGRPNAFEHFDGAPVELAVLRGTRLAELALRDFIGVEKHAGPGSVVVIPDVLPRTSREASRTERSGQWTGDLFKLYDVLLEHRPDLVVVPLNTAPTGALLVAGLDPASTVLSQRYAAIAAGLRTPDPQEVPVRTLRRVASKDPAALMASPVWAQISELGTTGAPSTAYGPVWRGLLDVAGYRGTEFEIEALTAEVERLEVRLAHATADAAALRKTAGTDAQQRLLLAQKDLRWLVRRLDRSPLGIGLRRLEGFRTLKQRWL